MDAAVRGHEKYTITKKKKYSTAFGLNGKTTFEKFNINLFTSFQTNWEFPTIKNVLIILNF